MNPTDRPQTLGEEIANSVSHGVGALGALLAAPLLIAGAARQGDAALVAGSAIFAASICLLYLASALYHALPRGRAKQIFNLLDHSAIYLLIAGTYTPFTLGPLRGPWGWTLLCLIWAMAGVGVALKASRRLNRPALSVGLYLAMGWLVAIAVKPVLEHVPAGGLALLLAGGLAYTAGVAFFVLDSRWRYAHFVWHLFVLAGTACHFFAALWYAVPATT